MSIDFDEYDLDRKFLNASAWTANVFSGTWGALLNRVVAPLTVGQFDNASSKMEEVAIRTLIVLGAVFCFTYPAVIIATVTLGAASKIFREAGFYFQKEGFTHIRGKGEEIALKGQASVMTWNIRGDGGGLIYRNGVVHWRSRVDRIVDDIKKENPDVIVLQDVHDISLVETLVGKLEEGYAHFYTHLGKDSGLMVITRCAVHSFSHTPFEVGKRGFETLQIKASKEATTPCARIIGTELTPEKTNTADRMEQFTQIVNHLSQQTLALPTLFVGSLHLDRDSEEGAVLSKYLYHSYLRNEPTHSEALMSQWASIYDVRESPTDFISFFKRNIGSGKILPVTEKDIRLLDTHLVRGFEEDKSTKTARSDHHGIVTKFSWSK
jgi:hypothetical protein